MICIECSERYLGYDDDDTMSSNEIGTCDWCLEMEEQERAEAECFFHTGFESLFEPQIKPDAIQLVLPF